MTASSASRNAQGEPAQTVMYPAKRSKAEWFPVSRNRGRERGGLMTASLGRKRSPNVTSDLRHRDSNMTTAQLRRLAAGGCLGWAFLGGAVEVAAGKGRGLVHRRASSCERHSIPYACRGLAGQRRYRAVAAWLNDNRLRHGSGNQRSGPRVVSQP